MEAATRRIPALLNANGEIAVGGWTRRLEYLILVPHNAVISTIAMRLVNQTLTLGTFYNAERRSEVPTSRTR
jgi:hypothetical protein